MPIFKSDASDNNLLWKWKNEFWFIWAAKNAEELFQSVNACLRPAGSRDLPFLLNTSMANMQCQGRSLRWMIQSWRPQHCSFTTLSVKCSTTEGLIPVALVAHTSAQLNSSSILPVLKKYTLTTVKDDRRESCLLQSIGEDIVQDLLPYCLCDISRFICLLRLVPSEAQIVVYKRSMWSTSMERHTHRSGSDCIWL